MNTVQSKAYVTNSDRLRSPDMHPAVWRENGPTSGPTAGLVSNLYSSNGGSAVDVNAMKIKQASPMSNDQGYGSVSDRLRYQPSEYVAMRNSSSSLPSVPPSTWARPPTGVTQQPAPSTQNHFVSPKPLRDGPQHMSPSMDRGNRVPMFSPGTASIHRDLDSVLDDIKRELSKSRPDTRLSVSIDASSLETAGRSSRGEISNFMSSRISETSGSRPNANVPPASSTTRNPQPIQHSNSQPTISSRIESLRSRLDSVTASRPEVSATASRQDSSMSSRPSSASNASTTLVSGGIRSDLSTSRSDPSPSLFNSANPARGVTRPADPPSNTPARKEVHETPEKGDVKTPTLAEGWEMKLDSPSGRIFYVNHALKAISWEPPLPPTPPKGTQSKSAVLDQLSERTKTLGAKLRDEMQRDLHGSSDPKPFRSSSTNNLHGLISTSSKQDFTPSSSSMKSITTATGMEASNRPAPPLPPSSSGKADGAESRSVHSTNTPTINTSSGTGSSSKQNLDLRFTSPRLDTADKRPLISHNDRYTPKSSTSDARSAASTQPPSAGAGKSDKLSEKVAERLGQKQHQSIAERVADKLEKRLGEKTGQDASGIGGLYGSSEHPKFIADTRHALNSGGHGHDARGGAWNIGGSGDGWMGGRGMMSSDSPPKQNRWGLGMSGDAYGSGTRGSFWQGGDKWDHGAGGRGGSAGPNLRSSLDSAKLALLERRSGGVGVGGGVDSSPRTAFDDPTLNLLNKASSLLWHHLLNGSSPAPHSPETHPRPSEMEKDIIEFDRWAKQLTQSTPRELDESPVKRHSNNATTVKAPAPAPPVEAALPDGVQANMAWQV